MSDVTVRRLTRDDLPFCTRLAADVLRSAEVATDRLRELLEDSRSIVLAAQVRDVPVGYVVSYCFPSLSGERLAYLYDIEVLADWRRQGVARMLVGGAVVRVPASGRREHLEAGSSLTNMAACELWRATGAQRDGDQYVEFTFELT
ncbi:MAG: GNAT family N-acetyltransferase [Vicinamibacterales bacterium]